MQGVGPSNKPYQSQSINQTQKSSETQQRALENVQIKAAFAGQRRNIEGLMSALDDAIKVTGENEPIYQVHDLKKEMGIELKLERRQPQPKSEGPSIEELQGQLDRMIEKEGAGKSLYKDLPTPEPLPKGVDLLIMFKPIPKTEPKEESISQVAKQAFSSVKSFFSSW